MLVYFAAFYSISLPVLLFLVGVFFDFDYNDDDMIFIAFMCTVFWPILLPLALAVLIPCSIVYAGSYFRKKYMDKY
jgi:hypothetical protein